MKLLLLAFVIAALQSDTTALVEASKDAKSKRKTSTTKVITNADVKKSKGKVVQKPGTPAPATDTKPEPTSLEKQAMERAARQIAEARLATAQKLVAELERELAAIETSYYETNDLDYRDKVLTKRFADVKARLDEARKESRSAAAEPPL